MSTTPQAGDVVRIDRAYAGVKPGALAVIDTNLYWDDVLAAVVAASAFREGDYVSCSGGPCPAINPAELVAAGRITQRFWKWNQYGPGKGNGEEYDLRVNLWTWS